MQLFGNINFGKILNRRRKKLMIIVVTANRMVHYSKGNPSKQIFVQAGRRIGSRTKL